MGLEERSQRGEVPRQGEGWGSELGQRVLVKCTRALPASSACGPHGPSALGLEPWARPCDSGGPGGCEQRAVPSSAPASAPGRDVPRPPVGEGRPVGLWGERSGLREQTGPRPKAGRTWCASEGVKGRDCSPGREGAVAGAAGAAGAGDGGRGSSPGRVSSGAGQDLTWVVKGSLWLVENKCPAGQKPGAPAMGCHNNETGCPPPSLSCLRPWHPPFPSSLLPARRTPSSQRPSWEQLPFTPWKAFSLPLPARPFPSQQQGSP